MQEAWTCECDWQRFVATGSPMHYLQYKETSSKKQREAKPKSETQSAAPL